MDPILSQIRQELAAGGDPEIRKSSQRFFREPIRCHGLNTATVSAIAKRYWKEIKNRPKSGIYDLCEMLLQSGYIEESFIAARWSYALSWRYDRGDLALFGHWIDAYITNWASCDGFCNHTLGDFVVQYPDSIGELMQWASSENRWMRRAAAVSLIIPAKHGNFLAESLAIADRLLSDREDMVQKGYGWLLKEASRNHPHEVFAFVRERRAGMPRTALRYAIELLPADLKSEAMKLP